MTQTIKWPFKRLIVSTLLLALAFFFAYSISQFLDQRIREVRDNLIAMVEEKIGRKITYQNFSPNYLQAIEIRGLKVFDVTGQYEILSIPVIKIDLNLLAVITAQFDELINNIQLDNLNVKLDLDQDTDLMKFILEIVEVASKNPKAPWPNLDIHNAQLVLKTAGKEFNVNGFSLKLSDDKKEGQFFLEGNIQGEQLSGVLPFSQFSTQIIGSGRSNHSTLDTFIQLTVKDFDTPDLHLRDLSIQASLIDSILSVKKVQDKKPIDLSVVMDLKTNDLGININSQNFILGDLFEVKGKWSQYIPYTSTAITGKLTLNHKPLDDLWNYYFDGSLLLPLPQPLGASRISGKFQGNQFKAEIPQLTLTSEKGILAYSGIFLIPTVSPNGTLTTKNFSIVPGLTLNGSVSISSENGKTSLLSENFYINDLSAKEFSLTTRQTTGALAFNLTSKYQTENLDIQEAKINVEGSINFQNNLSGNVDIEITKFPIKYIFPIIPSFQNIPGIVTNELNNYLFSVQTTLNFGRDFLDFPDLFFQVDHATNPLRGIEGNIGKTNKEMIWKDIRFKWDYWITEIQASLTLEKILNFKSVIKTGDLVFSNEGLLDSVSGNGSLMGNYGVSAKWEAKPNNDFHLAIKTEELPLPHILEGMKLSFDGDLNLQSQNWDAKISEFQLLGKNLSFLDDFIFKFKGQFNDQAGTLQEVSYIDRSSNLLGRAQYDLAANKNDYTFLGNLNDPKGSESYNFNGFYKDQKLTGLLSFINFPIDRIHNLPLKGKISGAIGITDTPNGPLVEVKSNLDGKTLNNDSLTFNTQVRFQGDQISLMDSNFSLGSFKIKGLNGLWDLSTGNISTRSQFDALMNDKKLSGNFDSNISLNRKIDLNELESLILDRINGQIRLYGVTLESKLLDNITIDFSKVKSILTFRGGKENFLQGRIADSGDFKFVLRKPSPVQFDIEGKLTGRDLVAKITQLDLDLSLFRDIINSPILKLNSGRLTGNLQISGINNDPDFYGSLKVDGLAIETSFLTFPLKDLKSEILFEGKTLKMERATATANQGKILASAELQLDHWGISKYNFRLDTIESTPLPISYQLTGLDVKGLATGRISLVGSDSSAILGGDIVLQDVKVMLNLKQEEGTESGSEDLPLTVDINVQTGRRVEFIWPNETLAIGRAYPLPGQKVKILVDGITGKYQILGDVQIRGGEINYFNNTFYLKEGRMVFKEDNSGFDPKVTITAELRQYFEDKPLAIFLKVDDFLSRFSPRFESSPPKSPDELMAVLTQTLAIPEEYTNVTSVNTAISIASDVGTTFLLKPAVDTLKKLLNLDLFSLKTQFIKKAFIGNQTQEPFSVSDYLDNTSIFLGKYLGDSLFLEGLMNFSTKGNETTSTGDLNNLQMQFELGMELQTPWMLINWRFVPKSPDKLFIPDNTISFSWRFTY